MVDYSNSSRAARSSFLVHLRRSPPRLPNQVRCVSYLRFGVDVDARCGCDVDCGLQMAHCELQWQVLTGERLDKAGVIVLALSLTRQDRVNRASVNRCAACAIGKKMDVCMRKCKPENRGNIVRPRMISGPLRNATHTRLASCDAAMLEHQSTGNHDRLSAHSAV